MQRLNYFSREATRQIADALEIDWNKKAFDMEQFHSGLEVELEHGPHYPATDITHDDSILIGKLVLAHLNQFPDYYTRLARMRAAAERQHRVRSGTNAACAEYLELVNALNENLEALETTAAEFMNRDAEQWHAARTELEQVRTILEKARDKLTAYLEKGVSQIHDHA